MSLVATFSIPLKPRWLIRKQSNSSTYSKTSLFRSYTSKWLILKLFTTLPSSQPVSLWFDCCYIDFRYIIYWLKELVDEVDCSNAKKAVCQWTMYRRVCDGCASIIILWYIQHWYVCTHIWHRNVFRLYTNNSMIALNNSCCLYNTMTMVALNYDDARVNQQKIK